MRNHIGLCINFNLGFTLAEILITLGIIGVVAAVTIPNIVAKYRRIQLETAFKKSSSIIEQALKDTAYNFGYDKFSDINAICNKSNDSTILSCKQNSTAYFKEINDYFLSHFKILKKLSAREIQKYKFKNYSGLYTNSYNQLYGITGFNTPNNGAYILTDGSLISAMTFFYHGQWDGISFTFDTNGPNKGPNRYGYDLFLYNTANWYNPCNANTNGDIYNGRGCYKYALQNTNPNDSTKEYWKSLKF